MSVTDGLGHFARKQVVGFLSLNQDAERSFGSFKRGSTQVSSLDLFRKMDIITTFQMIVSWTAAICLPSLLKSSNFEAKSTKLLPL